MVLAAELSETPVTRLAILASALTGGDAVGALDCFSSSAAEIGAIESYVQALTAQTEIACTIDTISESGEDPVRVLETDWLIQLTARTSAVTSERRRQRVAIQMRLDSQKGKQKWKINHLNPLSILFPINIR